MAVDARSNDLMLGIAGSGVMGQGVAQIAAQAGIGVVLFDTRTDAAANAKSAIQKTLAKLVEKGKLSTADAEAAAGRIGVAGSLHDFARCNVVLEAIVENLEAKRQLFRELESIVDDRCVLATNTSSLSVTEIAAGCRLPGRVGGFHFFNPVPLMKIVEVIDGLLTEQWVSPFFVDLATRMGHRPARAKDTPGFIVNHAGRGYVTESLRILGEGIAEIVDVDRILRETAGFRMGPFELLDLTALDVSHPAMEAIYNQYYQEPRLRPSPLARQRLMAGVLGRKTGRGFYVYTDGVQQTVAEEPAPAARPAVVWVSRKCAAGHALVTELVGRLGGTLDAGETPGPDSLCVVTPLGKDATTACLDDGLDPRRTVAIDALWDLGKRRTLMSTPVTLPEMKAAAHGLFAADGVPVTVLHDSPGFVAQRVIATIVNIGCDIVQQRVTTPEELDRAVTLGLGYPQGPLAWGDAVGPMKILTILKEMYDFYGDPRYRPSPWLVRRARLGVSLLTPEG